MEQVVAVIPHGKQGLVFVVHTGVRDKHRGLRLIYPSQGMAQLFGDVTIRHWRHYQPT